VGEAQEFPGLPHAFGSAGAATPVPGIGGNDEMAPFAVGLLGPGFHAALGEGITGVVLGCSREQVVWIHANVVIAGMADVESKRDWAVDEAPRPPVGREIVPVSKWATLAFDVKRVYVGREAIALDALASIPVPASTGHDHNAGLKFGNHV
jgi:hypothetical protein